MFLTWGFWPNKLGKRYTFIPLIVKAHGTDHSGAGKCCRKRCRKVRALALDLIHSLAFPSLLVQDAGRRLTLSPFPHPSSGECGRTYCVHPAVTQQMVALGYLTTEKYPEPPGKLTGRFHVLPSHSSRKPSSTVSAHVLFSVE